MTTVDASRCIEVGCQGWNYEDWVTGAAGGPIFYPRATRAAGMLEIYSRAFTTIEVDSTFYATPSVKTLDGWARKTPPHFTFALKLPQEITHRHLLRLSCLEALAEFCDRAAILEDKLAAVLIQLPPHFEMFVENVRALEDFLPHLPRSMRFAIEFRSPDWLQESAVELLQRHNVAVALVEGRWLPQPLVRHLAQSMTAGFGYVRWMGERDLTRFDRIQRPQDENLKEWHSLLVGLCERVPRVYGYFSNFYEGHAPESANRLKKMLGQPVLEPTDLEDQPSLF